jgi:hypothetical protein
MRAARALPPCAPIVPAPIRPLADFSTYARPPAPRACEARPKCVPDRMSGLHRSLAHPEAMSSTRVSSFLGCPLRKRVGSDDAPGSSPGAATAPRLHSRFRARSHRPEPRAVARVAGIPVSGRARLLSRASACGAASLRKPEACRPCRAPEHRPRRPGRFRLRMRPPEHRLVRTPEWHARPAQSAAPLPSFAARQNEPESVATSS